MKLSIIIPVLNSHEIVRRQLLHFNRMGLPADVELIIVDDGSAPPLDIEYDERIAIYGASTSVRAMPDDRMNIRLLVTGDTRPWTWALARNAGARVANGDYLLMFDVDHILLKDAIEFVCCFDGSKIQFKREFGVLDEQAHFTQDRSILEQYGLARTRGLGIGPLPNNFAMRKDLFWELGGYREDLVERPYPQGEDRLWKKTWYEYQRRTGATACPHRPTIYVFPIGKLVGDVDYNPMGLFHNLTRKTRRNHWYKRQVKGST